MPRFTFAALAVALLFFVPTVRAGEPCRVTLAFQSSVLGELHDCGCKSKPLGGLARRAAVLETLPHDTTLRLDGGNLFGPVAKHSPASDLFLAQQTAAMGYEVVGVGRFELERELDSLRQLSADSGLRFVNANLRRDGEAAFEPYRVLQVGDVRVGITGVFDDRTDRKSGGRALEAGFEVADPALALREVVPEMRERCDLVVVYAHLEPGHAQALLQSLGDGASVDFLIEGNGSNRFATVRRTGDTRILAANSRGKYLGQIDLVVQGSELLELEYTLHELTLDRPEQADVAAAVEAFEAQQADLARSR